MREGSTPKEIQKDLPRVAALIKQLQEGKSHKDSKTLEEWAEGERDFDDKKVRDYYIQQL